MAIIKQYTSRAYGSTRTLGDNGVALGFSNDGIIMGDEVLDIATLHPIQDAEARALKALVNHGVLGNSPMFSETPTVTHTHAQTEPSLLQADKTFYYQLEHETTNADLDQRIGWGTAFKFQDSTGKNHFLVDLRRIVSGIGTYYPQLMIVQGESLLNPENVYIRTLSATALTCRGQGNMLEFQLMAVDVNNKQIFFNAYSRNSSNYHYAGGSVFVADFTTTPADGSTSISDAYELGGIPSNAFAASRGFSRQRDFFCGFSASTGNPVFMFNAEADSHSYSSSTDIYHKWYGGSFAAYKSTTVDCHRVIFYSYDKGTNTCTTLADLNGVNGWGAGALDTTASGYSGITRLSGWVDSPIAGEGSIKYCYQMTADRVSGWTTTGLRYKWDTSIDSFEVAPISFDMTGSGAGSLSELLLHPCGTSMFGNATHEQKLGPCAMSCFFTKDASNNLFLTFATQFGSVESLSVASGTSAGNMVSFSLSNTDMLSCTYLAHSEANFLRAIQTSAEGTSIIAIHSGVAKLWGWAPNGFAEGLAVAGNFYGVTQRDDGSVWGVSMAGLDTFGAGVAPQTAGGTFYENQVDIHLLNQDIPNSVVVAFENPSITYNGVNFNTNLVVNAYDTSGSRVATDVTLKLSGASAVFQSNGGDTLSLSTSGAADTLVPLTVSGAGFINVSASFAI